MVGGGRRRYLNRNSQPARHTQTQHARQQHSSSSRPPTPPPIKKKSVDRHTDRQRGREAERHTERDSRQCVCSLGPETSGVQHVIPLGQRHLGIDLLQVLLHPQAEGGVRVEEVNSVVVTVVLKKKKRTHTHKAVAYVAPHALLLQNGDRSITRNKKIGSASPYV